MTDHARDHLNCYVSCKHDLIAKSSLRRSNTLSGTRQPWFNNCIIIVIYLRYTHD